MKVYLVEHFTDYESSEIVKVYRTSSNAVNYISSERSQRGAYSVIDLPTGWRDDSNSDGYIYIEMELEK